MTKTPYLTDGNVEDLGRMLMALLSEFWVLRDRVAILEEMLGETVGLTSAKIDAYVPSPELESRLLVLRDQVAGAVIAAPLLAQDRSIATILKLAGMTPPDRPGG